MGLCFGYDPKLRSDTMDSTISPTNTCSWIKLCLSIQDSNKENQHEEIFDYIDPTEFNIDDWTSFYEAIKIITNKHIKTIGNWKYNLDIFVQDSNTKVDQTNWSANVSEPEFKVVMTIIQ